VVVIVGLTSLALLAGAGLASTGSSSSAAYQYGKKVTICHHTHSKKHPFVTITVAKAALKAHLKHGDTIGPCSSPNSAASKAKRAKAKAAAAAAAKAKAKAKGKSKSGSGSSSSPSHGQSGSHGNGHKKP
jgi:ABC-type sugar transport system substrate-binding protein